MAAMLLKRGVTGTPIVKVFMYTHGIYNTLREYCSTWGVVEHHKCNFTPLSHCKGVCLHLGILKPTIRCFYWKLGYKYILLTSIRVTWKQPCGKYKVLQKLLCTANVLCCW